MLLLFFPSCHSHLWKDVFCGHSQMPWEALRTVVNAARQCSGKQVGVPNVQGMTWTKRSYRSMLWHIVLNMREQNAEVWFLSDGSTSEWMSKGNKVVLLGLEEHTMLVNGMDDREMAPLIFFRVQSSRNAELFFSGAGKHPETARERHPECTRLHSRVPRFDGQRLRAHLT